MKGLVLCGGKSSRMGQDKSGLIYRKKPIREEIYDLLKLHCDEVYYSCHSAQFESWKLLYPCIPDHPAYIDHGPLTGVISALISDPHSDWMICACDYPMIRKETLENLIMNQGKEAPAIVYRHPESDFPEPLIGIYKKEMIQILVDALNQGNDSLRKILTAGGAELLLTEHPESLRSVDTPDEYQNIKNNKNAQHPPTTDI